MFFDFGDAIISHPFFSIRRYLDYIRPLDESEEDLVKDLRKKILDSYLNVWRTQYHSDQVDRAWELIEELYFYSLTIRWWRELPYVRKDMPWGRDVHEMVQSNLQKLVRS